MRGLNNRPAVADVAPEVTQRSFQAYILCTHGDSTIKTVLRSPGESSHDSSITIINVVGSGFIYPFMCSNNLHENTVKTLNKTISKYYKNKNMNKIWNLR